MTSRKSKINLGLAIIFSIISAAVGVAVAFVMGQIMSAAENRDLAALWPAIWLTLGVWIAEFATNLIAVRFRLIYTFEMLFLARRSRMAFLFGRRLKTPAEDNNKDLSFFTADIDVLRDKYYRHQALMAFRIATIVFSGVALVLVNPWLTLAIVGLMLFLVGITAPFGKGLNRRTKAYSDAAAEYVDVARECIQGQREIIAYDKQEIFLQRHEKENAKVEGRRMKAEFFEVLANFVAGYSNFLMFMVVLAVSAYFIIRGDMNFAEMIIVIQLVQNVAWPVTHFVEGLNGMRAAKGLVEKAKERVGATALGRPLPGFNDSIEIRNLGLKYDDDTYVVQGLNLSFKKGGKYAIFAPSGYGKTSVARALALEFLEFDGSIEIDGQDIRDVEARDYNKIVRYVRQDPYLFSDTAFNNLTFFGDAPNLSDLAHALNLTRVADFLNDEEALNRHISNTSGLSGGQKQRIVLARALLHGPQVLILDEITSGVDLDTACDILSDLFADKDLTVIAITHENDERFQGLFDEIVRLDK
ncbi:MAG: ABC transporter ATP-binding protein/permease [Clostridiales bacterium]|nr:ABC transporter ATP-binding protein/permease [Clostridiales bacterium]